jgi:hemerythrin-like domain-containing protein
MMPIGPLMIEHRLIERMITLMTEQLNQLQKDHRIDVRFIEQAVQFMKAYADQCHHGKEEDILFRELRNKPITQEHDRIITELMEEHEWGRNTTGRLVEANERYGKGEDKALGTIEACLKDLVAFYPQHIRKEDKSFFIPVMDYFTEEEKDAMLKEGQAFDSNLIHQEYDRMVSQLENNSERQ